MELHFEQVVAASPEELFSFYRNPDNLRLLLRRWPRFRMLHHDGPIRLGGVMWVEERFWGIPVAMGFRHFICRPPHQFGGELFHGPFSRFVHTHTFEAVGAGQTRIRDHVDVRVPWHFGGDALLARHIAPLLRRAFSIRQQELAHLARNGLLNRSHNNPLATCEIDSDSRVSLAGAAT